MDFLAYQLAAMSHKMQATLLKDAAFSGTKLLFLK